MIIRRLIVLVCILLSWCFFGENAQAAQGAPAVPTGLKVQAGDTQAVVSWTPVAGASSYNVYRSTNSSPKIANSTKVGNHAGAEFTDTGLINGTQYSWIVTAVDANGQESTPSLPASATPTQASTQVQGASSQQQQTTGSPSTNIGTTTNSNIQNPTLTLSPIPQLPPKLSVSAGSLGWSDSDTYRLILNACDPKIDGNPITLPSFDSVSTYALINVLRLSDPNSGSQTVQSSNWYVYSKQKHWYRGWLKGWSLSDFDGSTRMYGAENVVLISILLNDQSSTSPNISYKMTITKQQPSNIADVYALLGTIFPAAPTAAPLKANPNSWGCALVPIAYKTASVKADTTLSFGGSTPFAASLTFSNEPKEWWDVSFALPVSKVSALQYSSTNNTVTPTQINKQSLFAVFDWYIPPTNLSATSYNLIPHPFAGVAMNSQPLHSLLFGASIGLSLAEVYAGAVLVKQQQLSGLSSGGTATPDELKSATSYGYKAGFSIGIKISVKAAVSAFSSAKSK